MKPQKIKLKQIFKILNGEWPFLSISLVTSLFFVLFNSISIWLIASLLNSIFSNYDQLITEYKILLLKDNPTLNEKLKLFANDFILRESPVETLKILCLLIISIFIAKNIFLYLKNLSMAFVQLRIVTLLRNRLYTHFHSLSLSFFQRNKFGDLTSILTHDVGNLNMAIGTSFNKIIVEPFNILMFGILLFIISWKLSLVAVVIIPFSQMVITTIGKSIRRKSRRNTKQIGGILSIITETLSSIRIVKSFAMEAFEINRFNKESWKYFKLLFRSDKLKYLSPPIIEMIGVTIAVILLWIGGTAVMKGGDLSSEDFLRFLLLLFAMLGPIRSLSNVHLTLQNGLASAERIFRVLDTEPEITNSSDSVVINNFRDQIKFKQVNFSYEENDSILTDISFTIPKGDVLALVGPSGAGKSTIADLIPRFYDVTSGSIEIDGKDIRTIELNSLRKMLGIVSQEILLFNDSIASNIAYGQNEINLEKITEAAQAANALEFIIDTRDGFDTIIGEKGVKLSGGQKQRLAIARAILDNPPILILDEATSSLDTESEKLVQGAVERLMKDRTVLVIAHRLSTVVNADKIIVLKEGKTVEIGTHEELLQQNGQYKKLYDIQFTSE